MTTRQEEESGFRDETPFAVDQSSVQGQMALRVRVAELCPTLFDIHETYRDGVLVKYVSWKDDEEIQEREWLAACAEFRQSVIEPFYTSQYGAALWNELVNYWTPERWARHSATTAVVMLWLMPLECSTAALSWLQWKERNERTSEIS